MDIADIINEAGEILDVAQTKYDGGADTDALESLFKLREFLNAQPELEAGGAAKERYSS